MEETLKMMKQIIVGYEGGKDIEELIVEYKNNYSPNILAYLFQKYYKLIFNTGSLYPLINSDDLASYALQELNNCIISYDKSKNANLSTYFIKCFKNRLQSETQTLNYNYKKAMNNYYSLDELNNNIQYFDDYFDINEFTKEKNLTPLQSKCCRLLSEGYNIL